MTRNRLPGRRPCETFDFVLSGMKFTASIGFDPKGQPAEVFLTAGRAGTDLAISMQESAILVSLALQYGCPLETLRSAALRAEGGRAEGPIGCLIDLICNRLTIKPVDATP